MSKIVTNVLIFGGIIALGAFGYYLFVLNQSSEPVAGGDTGAINVEAATLVSNLSALQAITLDVSVLNNQRFGSLKDNTQPLPTIATGRTNPFAEASAGATTVVAEVDNSI